MDSFILTKIVVTLRVLLVKSIGFSGRGAFGRLVFNPPFGVQCPTCSKIKQVETDITKDIPKLFASCQIFKLMNKTKKNLNILRQYFDSPISCCFINLGKVNSNEPEII